MKPSTETSIIVTDNTEHHLIIQSPHELMILEHHLPTLQPEHQELMNIEPHTAVENISDHNTALVKKTRSRNLTTKSTDMFLVKQDV